ncbi:MAG: histidine phosphatase family protein [Gammaproteobacteria bacterium]|nr:histidine phosphatase family protein [Gammaproteobacteria bacterium]
MKIPEMIMTLIRHGISDFNIEGRFQGSGNLAKLSKKGIEQAYLVGDTLRDHLIDNIYTSPLLRAKQTAEIIAKVIDHPHPIQFDDRLREVDIPEWQGLRYSEILQRNPTLHKTFYASPENFEMYLNGILRRPLFELYQRVSGFMHEQISKSNSRILVVSHLGTNQALINAALGLSDRDHHRIQQSHCALSRLEFRATGAAELTKLNNTRHLGQSLPKIKSQKTGVRLICIGCTDRKNMMDLDFNISHFEERCIWVESGFDTEGVEFPVEPVVFRESLDELDQSLTERINRLRRNSNKLQTLLIVVRSDFLTKIAESLFGVPPIFFSSVKNSSKFVMIIHGSSEHKRPIVQLLNNSIEGFLKQ